MTTNVSAINKMFNNNRAKLHNEIVVNNQLSDHNTVITHYTEIPLYNIDNENSSDLWMKYEEKSLATAMLFQEFNS